MPCSARSGRTAPAAAARRQAGEHLRRLIGIRNRDDARLRFAVGLQQQAFAENAGQHAPADRECLEVLAFATRRALRVRQTPSPVVASSTALGMLRLSELHESRELFAVNLAIGDAIFLGELRERLAATWFRK